MEAGDKIRIQKYMYDTPTHQDDYTVEKFRHCLGIFLSTDDRKASKFTPLCELYEPAPDAEKGYIGNYGEYWDKWVQGWMDLPK